MSSNTVKNSNIEKCESIKNNQLKEVESKNDSISDSQTTEYNSRNVSVNSSLKIQKDEINKCQSQVLFPKIQLIVEEEKEIASPKHQNEPKKEKTDIKNEIEKKKENQLNSDKNMNKEKKKIQNMNVMEEKKEEKLPNAVKNEQIKNKKNDGFSQSFNIHELNEKPPKIIGLYNAEFNYSCEKFGEMGEIEKIPNHVFNHILINNENKNYCKISINKRHSGKVSTLIYYSP